MFIRMPNDEWCLSKHSEDKIISYTFLRSPIKDSSGRAISPAILIYIDDAKIFDKNVTKFSITKRGNFVNVGLKLDKISSPSDKGYPIAYKNSLFMKTSYTDKNNMEHILYTAYIINNDDKGIQIYMDMTKDISKTCETEFMQAFKSIKEIKK